jgi:hypothetical protein
MVATRQHGFGDLIRRPLRDPPVENLAGPDEVVHHAARLGDGCPRVEPMTLVEVDVIGTEPPQRCVELLEHVLAGQAAFGGPLPHREEHLRREHVRRASRARQRRSDDLFGPAACILVGRVEEVDTQVTCTLDASLGAVLVDRRAVRQPGSQRDDGHLQT